MISDKLRAIYIGTSSPTLEYVTYTICDGSSTITISSSAQAGDIAVIQNRASVITGSPTNVTPSGFTEVIHMLSSNNATRVRTSYKLLVSGDPGSSVGVNYATFTTGAICWIFRPSTAIASLSVASLNYQMTDSNPTAQTVSSQTAPYLVLGDCGSSATPSFNSTWEDQNVRDSYVRGGYAIINSSPSDYSIDMNDLGSRNHLISFALVPTFS